MAIENRGPEVEATAIVFLTLAWVSVGLRCFVKIHIKKLFRIDDWLAVLSLISFTFFCAVVIAGAKTGTGRHKEDIPPDDFATSMMWWYCGQISYITTTAFVKACIGLFLLQICVKKYQKYIIWSVIFVTTIYSIIYVFIMAFECSPVSYFWTRFNDKDGEGSCIQTYIVANMTYAHGVISTISDWTVGILPIFLVWNLNMNLRTKVSVALILSLGALGSTASIVRFPYIRQLTQLDDFLWCNSDVSIWSTIEPGIGITASSMATMRPLFVAFLSRSRLLGSSNRSTNPWDAPQRQGGSRKREIAGAEELGLTSDLGKTGIRVTTTVTKTQSPDDKPKDLGGDTIRQSSESVRVLKGENEWGPKSADDSSSEDAGHGNRVTIEGGMPSVPERTYDVSAYNKAVFDRGAFGGGID